MTSIISKLQAKFQTVFNHKEAGSSFFSPGRVNLIGEHTDYNGGHGMSYKKSVKQSMMQQVLNYYQWT